MQNIYEWIYAKLDKIRVFKIESHTHLESPGLMDLYYMSDYELAIPQSQIYPI